jgi:glucose 1-dehydrogenase
MRGDVAVTDRAEPASDQGNDRGPDAASHRGLPPHPVPDPGTAGRALPLLGQWAVVTGASKGIGRGIAGRFVAAGANVVLVARSVGPLEAAREELQAAASDGQVVRCLPADTSSTAAVEELFATLAETLPHLNVFVANAGSGVVTPFLDLPLDEWNDALALNLTGTFLGCQLAARAMIRAPQENMAILVVSSIRAVGVRPGRLAYAVTKAGLNQLVRMAAYELAPHGIRVNALSPGITATPLALEGNPEIFAEMVKEVPLGRAGIPTDMAEGALYLCSPAAAFVTGANLVVDGGESLY